MSINASASSKTVSAHRMLVIGLMIVLGIVVTTGFVWMQTNPVIAPPGLRMLDELWKVFICRCISIDGPIQLGW